MGGAVSIGGSDSERGSVYRELRDQYEALVCNKDLSDEAIFEALAQGLKKREERSPRKKSPRVSPRPAGLDNTKSAWSRGSGDSFLSIGSLAHQHRLRSVASWRVESSTQLVQHGASMTQLPTRNMKSPLQSALALQTGISETIDEEEPVAGRGENAASDAGAPTNDTTNGNGIAKPFMLDIAAINSGGGVGKSNRDAKPTLPGFDLKIEIDDESWEQVEDDEELSFLSPRKAKPRLSVHVDSTVKGNDASCLITQSGAIRVKGFKHAIRESGISTVNVSGLAALEEEALDPSTPKAAANNTGRERIQPIDGAVAVHFDPLHMTWSQSVPMRHCMVRLQKLGQGASGIVYKALDLLTLRLFAVKVIPVFDKEKRQQLRHELKVLYQNLASFSAKTGRQPRSSDDGAATAALENAAKPPSPRAMGHSLSEAALSGAGNTGDGDGDGDGDGNAAPSDGSDCGCVVAFYDAFGNVTEGSVSLLLEFMDGGSLQDIADAGGCKSEEILASIAKQALRGLQFLHSKKQIHRDLKPANLLINRRGRVKLSDLGIIRQLGGNGSASASMQSVTRQGEDAGNGSASASMQSVTRQGEDAANTFVGTLTYMSPERINGQSYSYAADIWSLGLSMMTCAVGRFPMANAVKGGYWSVLACVRDAPAPELQGDDWSDEFRDFIKLCLDKDPANRPSCEALLGHAFLSKAAPADDFAQNGDADSAAESAFEELDFIIDAVKVHLEQLRSGGGDLFSDFTPPGSTQSEITPPPSMSEVFFGSDATRRLAPLAYQLALPVADIVRRVEEVLSSQQAT